MIMRKPILSPFLSERKLRLALLTDFHNGEPMPVLHSLEKQRPDFICIAGDLVRGRAPKGCLLFDEQNNVLPFLHGCLNTAPTFMSLGNHENVLSDEDIEIIKGTGVILLDNESLLSCRIDRIFFVCGEKNRCGLEGKPKLGL